MSDELQPVEEPQTETAKLLCGLVDDLLAHVEARVAPLIKRIAEQDIGIIDLVARIDVLEQRQAATEAKAIAYRGTWSAGNFVRGDVVTYQGTLWHCQVPTTDKPGSASWRLMQKGPR